MIPQQTRGLLPNVGLTLAHRLQRRPDIEPMTRVCWGYGRVSMGDQLTLVCSALGHEWHPLGPRGRPVTL